MWPLARTANTCHAPKVPPSHRLLHYIWCPLGSTLARATGMVWLVVVSSKTSLSLVFCLPLSSADSSSPPSGGLVRACPTFSTRVDSRIATCVFHVTHLHVLQATATSASEAEVPGMSVHDAAGTQRGVGFVESVAPVSDPASPTMLQCYCWVYSRRRSKGGCGLESLCTAVVVKGRKGHGLSLKRIPCYRV